MRLRSLAAAALLLLATITVHGQRTAVTSVGLETPNVFTNTDSFNFGVKLGPITFSQLSTLTNSTTIIYVSDGVFGSNPCAGGGTGALAVLIAGQWTCSGGGGGGISLLVNSVPSTSQTRLNLIAGTNVTLVNIPNGDVVIDAAGGGGGTPGGSDTQRQVNNSSSFGGEFNGTYNFTTGEEDAANHNKIRSPSPTVGTTYNFLQHPSDDLSSPGAGKTITFTCSATNVSPGPCVGMDTSANAAKPYSVYIATVGTPEAALVTGGTCSLFATANCTVIVTTANAHTAGYTVQSAYGGIQEALNDAGTPDAKVVLQPVGANANAYQIFAPIFMQNQRSVLEGDGSFLKCYTRSMCLVLGDLLNSNNFLNERIHGMRIASGTNIAGVGVSNTSRTGCPGAGTCQINITTAAAHPFIVGDYVDIQMANNPAFWGIWKITSSADNTHFVALYASQVNVPGPGTNIGSAASIGQVALANSAIWDNAGTSVMSEIQLESGGAGPGTVGLFHNGIVVFNDQAALIDKPSLSSGSAFRCDSTYCSNVIYGPGPFFPNAGVITVRGNVLSSCGANLITNYDGNTLSVSDIVLQAFPQWAINNTAIRGGFGTGTYSNIYNEVGGCTNPDYPGSTSAARQAEAGIIGGGTVRGGEFPIGNSPVFDCVGAAGSNFLYYWVIVKDSVSGTSAPLFAGNTASTCSGNVTVQWPRVQGTNTITYDLVRVGLTGGGGINGPSIGNCGGGSVLACGSAATAQAQCSAKTCSFTDNSAASTSSYTIVNPGYFPELYFWPGAAILGANSDTVTVSNIPHLYMDNTNFITGVSQLVSESAWLMPSFSAQECSTANATSWISCLAAGSSSVGATVLQGNFSSGIAGTNLKGRINFNWGQGLPQGAIITLADSCPSCTWADRTKRPAQSISDMWIGNDKQSASQLTFHAPIMSRYISSLDDNTSWLERLTATKDEFRVSTQMDSNFSILGTCLTGCGPFTAANPAADSFNRADGSCGANWTITDGTCNIVSKKATYTFGGDGHFMGAYSAIAFGNDQCSQVIIDTVSSSLSGVMVRGSLVAETGYVYETSASSSNIDKVVAGVVTNLATLGPGDVDGDAIQLCVQGTALKAYKNFNPTPVLSVSDATIASGNPGLWARNNATGKFVFWAGGDAAWNTTQTLNVNNIVVNGTCTGCGSGSVTNSGALTNTAFVTGVGAAVVKTPSATATLDASGNAIFPGSITSTLVNGGVSGAEGTGANAGAAGAGVCVAWNDSTDHRPKYNCNNAGNVDYASTLPSGTVTTAGTVVNAGTSQAQTNITVTGALTTDNVVANIGATLPATWQTGIVLWAHVTAANTVTVYLTNPTAGNITPVATLVTVRILR